MPETIFQRGNRLMRQEKLDEAAAVYREAIEQNSNFYPYYQNLGKVLKKMNQLKAAEETIKRAIEIKPNLSLLYFDLGDILAKQGKTNESQQYYQKGMDLKNRKNSDRESLKSVTNISTSIERENKKIHNKTSKTSTQNTEISNVGRAKQYYWKGENQLQEGRLSDAIASYRRAIDLNPNHFLYHHSMGILLHKLGKFQSAVSSYRHALSLNPNYSWSYYHLGRVFQSLGNVEEALSCYRTIKTFQSQPEEVVERTKNRIKEIETYLEQKKQLDNEIKTYRQQVAQNPQNPENYKTYNQLAQLLERKGDSLEALFCYRKITHIRPFSPWFQTKLAKSLFKLGLLDEAINSYQKSLKIDPNASYMVYRDLGEILNQRRNLKERDLEESQNKVIDRLQEYTEFQAVSAEAKYELAVIFNEKREWNKAISLYEKIIELNPDIYITYASYEGLGDSFSKQGKDREAVNCYKKAIQIYPDSLSAYYKILKIEPYSFDMYISLAKILEKKSQCSKAATLYQSIINMKPNSSESQDAQVYLAQIQEKI
mgnify:CR=1 FL=1